MVQDTTFDGNASVLAARFTGRVEIFYSGNRATLHRISVDRSSSVELGRLGFTAGLIDYGCLLRFLLWPVSMQLPSQRRRPAS